jgi:glycosyltransferase involved in cell wall biosynthesis
VIHKIQLIIPTHNHPETLQWSIKSAQEQTISSVRIVVIGDGVQDDSREVVQEIMKEDSRVHFIDKPKAKRHGEEYRHEVIEQFSEPLIAYLGDDDLLFTNHLETLIETIGDCNFVNSFPTIIYPDSSIHVIPTQISDKRFIDWHLNNERRNSISLTGVMHTREIYLRLPTGWSPAPDSDYSDHYMWKKIFAHPDFKGVTSKFATTAKFASSLRVHMTASDRELEIASFWEDMKNSNFQHVWNSKVTESVLMSAFEFHLGLTNSRTQSQSFQQRLEERENLIEKLEENLEIARTESEFQRDQFIKISNSWSWRVMSIPRKIHSILRKFVKSQ